MTLLEDTALGLYCPAADLYIDPRRRVARALITHAHADHARPGHKALLTSLAGLPLVRERVGTKTTCEGLAWGETRRIGDALVSFHPAGHLLGSAQIRIEVGGRVAVVTGDYKRGIDPTCEPFEPVPCHLLVTETTFGLPVYRWPDPRTVAREIDTWWARNQSDGLTSVLLGYSLGKAQRLLALLDPGRGPLLLHGAVLPHLGHYRRAGIRLPETAPLNPLRLKASAGRALVVAPPNALSTSFRARLAPARFAFASGWMLLESGRKRRGHDHGFVLSDHVDWPELCQTVSDCSPEELWTTHGYASEVARHFAEQGLPTRALLH